MADTQSFIQDLAAEYDRSRRFLADLEDSLKHNPTPPPRIEEVPGEEDADDDSDESVPTIETRVSGPSKIKAKLLSIFTRSNSKRDSSADNGMAVATRRPSVVNMSIGILSGGNPLNNPLNNNESNSSGPRGMVGRTVSFQGPRGSGNSFSGSALQPSPSGGSVSCRNSLQMPHSQSFSSHASMRRASVDVPSFAAVLPLPVRAASQEGWMASSPQATLQSQQQQHQQRSGATLQQPQLSALSSTFTSSTFANYINSGGNGNGSISDVDAQRSRTRATAAAAALTAPMGGSGGGGLTRRPAGPALRAHSMVVKRSTFDGDFAHVNGGAAAATVGGGGGGSNPDALIFAPHALLQLVAAATSGDEEGENTLPRESHYNAILEDGDDDEEGGEDEGDDGEEFLVQQQLRRQQLMLHRPVTCNGDVIGDAVSVGGGVPRRPLSRGCMTTSHRSMAALMARAGAVTEAAREGAPGGAIRAWGASNSNAGCVESERATANGVGGGSSGGRATPGSSQRQAQKQILNQQMMMHMAATAAAAATTATAAVAVVAAAAADASQPPDSTTAATLTTARLQPSSRALLGGRSLRALAPSVAGAAAVAAVMATAPVPPTTAVMLQSCSLRAPSQSQTHLPDIGMSGGSGGSCGRRVTASEFMLK